MQQAGIRQWRKSRNYLEATKYAVRGLVRALIRERNIRLLLILTIAVCLAAVLFQVSAIELMLLLAMFGTLLSAELFNTALEALANAVHPDYHEDIRFAKDVAAGSVLVLALATLVVSIVILFPSIADIVYIDVPGGWQLVK